MHDLLWLLVLTVAGCLLLAGALHLLPRLGTIGQRLSALCCEAPGLDAVVFLLTTGGQVAGVVLGASAGPAWFDAWRQDNAFVLKPQWATWLGAAAGLVVGSVGQLLALWVWCRVHELVHHRVMRRPRIKGSLAKILARNGTGPGMAKIRNYVGVWWTLWAVPIFTCIRIGELTIYPIVARLVRLPRYQEHEWVRVSRQKFDGLVGADRIWCLYCDWMTGVWSLGSEMLRNIESFWCPIRFASPAKCANCTTDFPDLNIDWVKADGSIEDVAALIEKKYPGPDQTNSWSGHASRVGLTIGGKPAKVPASKL